MPFTVTFPSVAVLVGGIQILQVICADALHSHLSECYCCCRWCSNPVSGKAKTNRSKGDSVLLHHCLGECMHSAGLLTQCAVLRAHGNHSCYKCSSPGNRNPGCTETRTARLYCRMGNLKSTNSNHEKLKASGNTEVYCQEKKSREIWKVHGTQSAPQSSVQKWPPQPPSPKIARKGADVLSRLNPLLRRFDERGDSNYSIVWSRSWNLSCWTELSDVWSDTVSTRLHPKIAAKHQSYP